MRSRMMTMVPSASTPFHPHRDDLLSILVIVKDDDDDDETVVSAMMIIVKWTH